MTTPETIPAPADIAPAPAAEADFLRPLVQSLAQEALEALMTAPAAAPPRLLGRVPGRDRGSLPLSPLTYTRPSRASSLTVLGPPS